MIKSSFGVKTLPVFQFTSLPQRYGSQTARLATMALLLSSSFVGQTAIRRPAILGVAHISLYAHDYQASRDFYHQFLGFEEPFSLKKPDGGPSMTFFKVNDRQYIELSPEVEANSDRLNHYAIQTDSAEGMRAYLGAQGVAVPDHVPKGRIGNLNFMIKDPEGHNVEIVEYAADSWTMREKGKALPGHRVSKRMMHIGIVVTHVDEEMKFYTEVLGFRETWRGSSSGKVLSWINLKAPDSEDYIELMLFKEPPAPDKRGGAHHLCLEVPNVAESIAVLNANPYRDRYSRTLDSKTGVNRKRQVNVFDPDGTRTELMEPGTVDGTPAISSSAPAPDWHE